MIIPVVQPTEFISLSAARADKGSRGGKDVCLPIVPISPPTGGGVSSECSNKSAGRRGCVFLLFR